MLKINIKRDCLMLENTESTRLWISKIKTYHKRCKDPWHHGDILVKTDLVEKEMYAFNTKKKQKTIVTTIISITIKSV